MPIKETAIPAHWGNEAKRLITNNPEIVTALGLETEVDQQLFNLSLARAYLNLYCANKPQIEFPFPLSILIPWRRIINPQLSFIPKMDLAIYEFKEGNYQTEDQKRRAKDIELAATVLISRATNGMTTTTLTDINETARSLNGHIAATK